MKHKLVENSKKMNACVPEVSMVLSVSDQAVRCTVKTVVGANPAYQMSLSRRENCIYVNVEARGLAICALCRL
jgi:hypothetical protein